MAPSMTMMSDVDRACSMASPSVIVPARTAQIPGIVNIMPEDQVDGIQC